MFTLTRPPAAARNQRIAVASGLPVAAPSLLSLEAGLAASARLPLGFAHDRTRAWIGQGESAFEAARQAFQCWLMFDLGWVRVANPDARIAKGQVVAVEVHSLGL